MSAQLVRKSLEVVDKDFRNKHSKKRDKTEVFSLVPKHHQTVGKKYKKGKKAEKIGLPIVKKLTIQEAKKQYKSKEQIIEENRKKLKLIKENSRISLDNTIVNQIIERARTNRPVNIRKQHKSNKSKPTFTDEDFENFQKEYFGS